MRTLKISLAIFCLAALSISLNAQTTSWTYGTNAATLSPTTGNLGIGLTATTANKLSIQATSSTQNGLRINNPAGSATLLSHYNGGLAVGASSTPPANGLYVNGSVGIGSASSPKAKLDVTGNMLLSVPYNSAAPVINAMTIDVSTFHSSTNAKNSYFLKIRDVGSNSTRFIVKGDGNIGVGVAEPQKRLDIVGDMKLFVPFNPDAPVINAMSIDIPTLSTMENAQKSYFLRMMDLGNPGTSFIFRGDGNVGIGTINPYYKLDVEGTIRAHEIRVNTNVGADFVFDEDYALRPLDEVSDFIQANKHLPEIPPAANMIENGLDMGEFQIKLLQKIEELTLYMIELKKENDTLKTRLEILEK